MTPKKIYYFASNYALVVRSNTSRRYSNITPASKARIYALASSPYAHINLKSLAELEYIYTSK